MNFLPIKGYEEQYEVGEDGTIRSKDRTVLGADGVIYPFKGKVLRPSMHKDTQYLQVSLWKNNKGQHHYVHRLVAQAHIPNPKGKSEINHIDGNRVNSHKNNLEWVSSSENKLHAIATGLRVYTCRLTKEEFIKCLFDVINGESYASLSQRVPYKVPFLSVKLRSIARELNIENELNESLYQQRVERARINGAKNN